MNYLFFLFLLGSTLPLLLFSYSYKIETKSITTPITINQWNHIKKFLSYKDLTESMKTRINKLLYYKYETMAYWKAYQFKKFHSYKCKHLSVIELSLYSKMGLYKAIQKYNPTYPFYQFISFSIHRELCKGLTELYPICAITKSERIKKKRFSKIYFTNHLTVAEKKALWREKTLYQKLLQTKFIGKEDWLIDKNRGKEKEDSIDSQIVEKETYEDMWRKIHSLKPFQKRVFQLKYDFYFNKIRSNLEIAELMGCSEEWIRLQLQFFIKSGKINF
jgi:RNA polymerase sigma factor (sigma-70 family)